MLFLFWAIFYLFTNLTVQKLKVSEKQTKKQKKTPGDIILHICTKNYD